MASSSPQHPGSPSLVHRSLRVTRSATQSPLNFLESDGAGGIGLRSRPIGGAPEIRFSIGAIFQLLKAKRIRNCQEHLKTTLEESRAAQERPLTTRCTQLRKKERDDARAELEEAKLQDDMRQKLEMIKAQRERPAAIARLKALDSELEEARTGRDTESSSQAELRARTLERQLADCQSNVRSIKCERESLPDWPDQLRLKKNAAQLRSRLEELEHKAKLEMYNASYSGLKSEGAIERERDSLLAVRDDLQHRLSLAALLNCPFRGRDALDRERQLARREQAVREEEWQARQQIESEKIAAEGELQTARQKVAEVDSVIRAERERCQERVSRAAPESELRRSADERGPAWNRESRTTRTRLRTQTEARDELESRLRRHEAEAAAPQRTLWMHLRRRRSGAELAEAKECELGAQVEVLRKGVSHDEYNRVRKELRRPSASSRRFPLRSDDFARTGTGFRQPGTRHSGREIRRRRRLERSRRRTSNGRVEKPIG
uniref:TPH domain-containing protein n=1 Tax=Macrostomum lignano TaxID=282301 RepID=A0A1I8FKI9_9PLAT